MKKIFMNVGGLIIFYSIIVGGVLLLNQRFSYLNNINNQNSTYIAMNN